MESSPRLGVRVAFMRSVQRGIHARCALSPRNSDRSAEPAKNRAWPRRDVIAMTVREKHPSHVGGRRIQRLERSRQRLAVPPPSKIDRQHALGRAGDVDQAGIRATGQREGRSKRLAEERYRSPTCAGERQNRQQYGEATRIDPCADARWMQPLALCWFQCRSRRRRLRWLRPFRPMANGLPRYAARLVRPAARSASSVTCTSSASITR